MTVCTHGKIYSISLNILKKKWKSFCINDNNNWWILTSFNYLNGLISHDNNNNFVYNLTISTSWSCDWILCCSF